MAIVMKRKYSLYILAILIITGIVFYCNAPVQNCQKYIQIFVFDDQNNVSETNVFTKFNYSNYYNMQKNNFLENGFYRIINYTSKLNQDKTKTILYWDTFFGDKSMTFGFGKEIFKNCPVNNCFATNNRSYIPEEDFDAVIFHGARWNIEKGIPGKRKNKQRYIFFSLESPLNIYWDLQNIRNYFNWTMTYRRDSDIHRPYSLVEYNPNNFTLPKIEDIMKKPKKVAWLVSNCLPKKRKEYKEKLSKYISIDTYGHCGINCPFNNSCYEQIETEYKFYLSFENTFCGDYVTEKLFKMLTYNIIPIVFGNSDYRSIAPPHSVIDTKDFKSSKDLAEYLYYLDENPEEYLKYFEWKKNYKIIDSTTYALCQLCYLLHEPLETRVYSNIKDWFYSYNCEL